MEMKTMLSIPNTISKKVSVKSAIQASADENTSKNSIIYFIRIEGVKLGKFLRPKKKISL
ncbi:hypothetical protein M949_0748 [Riemerella anatipestifer CH3]|nr:hypothetical protein M949_0748 [Riemerella anatipestifer CH3]